MREERGPRSLLGGVVHPFIHVPHAHTGPDRHVTCKRILAGWACGLVLAASSENDQSGSTSKYQEVLIKDNSFRIGDTKFSLMSNGKAEIKNVVTDPASGQTYLDKAYATHET